MGGVTAFVMPALCYRHFCADRLSGAEAAAARLVAVFGAVGTAYSLAAVVWNALSP